MKPIDAQNCIKVFILKTYYAYYMFRPLLWPCLGRCITKGGYIEIVQMFLNQCTDVK